MRTLFNTKVITTLVLSAVAAGLVALDLTGRVEARALLVRAKAPAYKLSSYVKELERREEERADMAERLAHRSILLGRAERYKRENDALRALLGFGVELPYELTYAPVLERRAESWLETTAVGAGRDDGVVAGMPVVGAEGLVGRVARVTATAAEVELITSERVRVAATHAPTGTTGVYYADAEGRGRLAYLPRTTELKVGDLVVTAGTSRLFPPGLIIGYVRAVERPFDSMFAEVEVAPAENLAALESVFVVDWLPKKK
ncbi:MAG TPA: rod shape-determining protein MreC [bacterium]|nr:rod shape-determining protein MreC [bacterium]